MTQRSHVIRSSPRRAPSPGARQLATGAGWQLTEFVCTSGPGDRPFEERHAYVTLAAVLEGSFTYRAGNARAVLHPGAMLLGNAGACYECGHNHGRGDRCVALHIEPAYAAEIAASVGGGSAFKFRRPVYPGQTSSLPWFAHLDASALDPLGLDLAVATLVEEVMAAQADAAPGNTTVSGLDERRISQAVRHIEAHADQPLDLDGLAHVAGMSKYHFLRTFRHHLGVTPYQVVLATRLRRAAAALAQSATPVSTVAFDAGFGDLSTFNRHFRAAFKMTPLQYRRQVTARRPGP